MIGCPLQSPEDPNQHLSRRFQTCYLIQPRIFCKNHHQTFGAKHVRFSFPCTIPGRNTFSLCIFSDADPSSGSTKLGKHVTPGTAKAHAIALNVLKLDSPCMKPMFPQLAANTVYLATKRRALQCVLPSQHTLEELFDHPRPRKQERSLFLSKELLEQSL